MVAQKKYIKNIPAIIWGEESNKVFLFVHGKLSSKESAAQLAEMAEKKGYQTISFDLPEHGERKEEHIRCDIFQGMKELKEMEAYILKNWEEVSLYACSLGAYFSLQTYQNDKFKQCLFQSPILNMEYLIQQMFHAYGVSESMLKEKKEIPTPVDILSWDYYTFVKSNPIEKWNTQTSILYGLKDNLQSYEVINNFTTKIQADLTISKESEHAFMSEKDTCIVEKWLSSHIK